MRPPTFEPTRMLRASTGAGALQLRLVMEPPRGIGAHGRERGHHHDD